MDREVYTVAEVAEILGIGRAQAYEGVKNGVIPHFRINHRIICPKAQIHRMLEQPVTNPGDN